MKILVEIKLFSGRPNPSWLLENGEAKNLNDLLQNLPLNKNDQPMNVMDGLGYKGFILTITENDTEKTVYVFSNMISTQEKEIKIFVDENKVEKKLLQVAKEKGYGKFLMDN